MASDPGEAYDQTAHTKVSMQGAVLCLDASQKRREPLWSKRHTCVGHGHDHGTYVPSKHHPIKPSIVPASSVGKKPSDPKRLEEMRQLKGLALLDASQNKTTKVQEGGKKKKKSPRRAGFVRVGKPWDPMGSDGIRWDPMGSIGSSGLASSASLESFSLAILASMAFFLRLSGSVFSGPSL